MENKVVCIYHNDNDGITSAAIVNQRFQDVKFIPMDYGWNFDMNDIKDKDCIIVDFSFKNMQEIKEACKSLIWIDHHKTAMEQNPEMWDDKEVPGIRDLNKSGCELTWEHLMPRNMKMPDVVKYVGDYDTWTFRYGEDTKKFNETFKVEINNPRDFDMDAMFSNRFGIEKEYIEKGDTLLKAQETRIQSAFKSGKPTGIDGANGFICNSNIDASPLGNYICKQGYDVGIVWFVDGDMIQVDLRSIGETDVSIIAKRRGGGGHLNAAGFKVSVMEFEEILNMVRSIGHEN